MFWKITNATYIRGVYIGGVAGLVMFFIIVVVLLMLGVPISDILLAAPSVMIGFVTLWYYFLNNPDPTLLMPNIIPYNGNNHVSRSAYQTPLQNRSATIIEPKEKDSPNGLLASFFAPWQVEWETQPTELYLVFDIGNRGNQGVMLYEYRLYKKAESGNPTVVSLSPETQAVTPDNGPRDETLNVESTGLESRAFIRPKERITEAVKIPIDIPSTDNQTVVKLTLELYATSNHPVDSLYLYIRVDNKQNVVKWQAHRSRVQRTIRSVFK